MTVCVCVCVCSRRVDLAAVSEAGKSFDWCATTCPAVPSRNKTESDTGSTFPSSPRERLRIACSYWPSRLAQHGAGMWSASGARQHIFLGLGSVKTVDGTAYQCMAGTRLATIA